MTKTTWWIPALALALALPSPSSAGDGIVALQSADPSCADDSGDTYVNCGNGTVTDNRTGLVWLENTDCWGLLTWRDALEVVAGLSDLEAADPDDCGLSDGSSPGEWRLPSKTEWETMIADAKAMACVPAITNDQGDDCWSEGAGSSFTGVQSSFYWSPTSNAGNPTLGWVVNLIDGNGFDSKINTNYVWPVRGGQ